MILDMTALTSRASFWDSVSVISAGAVLLGVAMESVADFELLARWTRLETVPGRRRAVSKAGLLLLIVALAVEVAAAIGSHNINTDIVAALNAELDTTIKHDIELTKLTESLRLSNRELQSETKDQANFLLRTNKQMGEQAMRDADIAHSVAEQQGRDARALTALKDDEAKLNTARNEALASATTAKKLVAEANAALAEDSAEIRRLRTDLSDLSSRAIVTEAAMAPRTLSLPETLSLIGSIKRFRGQAYEAMLPTTSDDARPLWAMLDKSLTDAGWKRLPAHPPTSWGDPPASIGADLEPGIVVIVGPQASASTIEAAHALADALRNNAHLLAKFGQQKTDQFDVASTTVGIIIGQK